MTDPATRLMTALQQVFDRLPPLPAELAAPGLLLLVLWPALSVALPTPTEAFMTAFAIALAMRLALRSRIIILTARARLPHRATAALVLAAGPGLLALLLLAGDPLIAALTTTGEGFDLAGVLGLLIQGQALIEVTP